MRLGGPEALDFFQSVQKARLIKYKFLGVKVKLGSEISFKLYYVRVVNTCFVIFTLFLEKFTKIHCVSQEKYHMKRMDETPFL